MFSANLQSFLGLPSDRKATAQIPVIVLLCFSDLSSLCSKKVTYCYVIVKVAGYAESAVVYVLALNWV